jgi:hypothetical protein
VRRLGGREQLADQHSAKQAGGHYSNTSSGQYIHILAKKTQNMSFEKKLKKCVSFKNIFWVSLFSNNFF